MKRKIALLYTWPGVVINAEREVIYRIGRALANVGILYDVISKEGFILDAELNTTDIVVNPYDYDFMLSLHYDDVKVLDIFSYHALWNPPPILLQYAHYTELIKQVSFNDDFLLFNKGSMKDYLLSIINPTQLNLATSSSLTPSFPLSALQKPTIRNPRLFYCGVNWEKGLGNSLRHKNLFKLLDERLDVDIYGPVRGWSDFKNYRGSIEFDGFSILNVINECGVCLALSSESHYQYGVASNRIYEGIVAGAVVISDTNSFVKEHFGDSILYIDFMPHDPRCQFEQIIEHLEWIQTHREEAQQLVLQAQQIFCDSFTLEKQLEKLYSNHRNRLESVAGARYSQESWSKTFAFLFADELTIASSTEKYIEVTIRNLERQHGKELTLVIVCDQRNERVINELCSNTRLKFIVVPYHIYSKTLRRQKTRSRMLCETARSLEYDYFLILNGTENLFVDHIETLKRCLEDNPECIVAHSGLAQPTGSSVVSINSKLEKEDLFKGMFSIPEKYPPGVFLMRASIIHYLLEEYYPFLDGIEVAALLSLAIFKHHNTLEFSRRITCSYTDKQQCVSFSSILPFAQQINFLQGLLLWEHRAFQREKSFTPLHGLGSLATDYVYKICLHRLKSQRFLLHFRLFTALTQKRRQYLRTKIQKNLEKIKEIQKEKKGLFKV